MAIGRNAASVPERSEVQNRSGCLSSRARLMRRKAPVDATMPPWGITQLLHPPAQAVRSTSRRLREVVEATAPRGGVYNGASYEGVCGLGKWPDACIGDGRHTKNSSSDQSCSSPTSRFPRRALMTIICGTDFSENAAHAARAAAAIAKRLGVPLKLVHVIDEIGAELSAASDHDTICEPLREQTREQAAELAARFGIDVEPVVLLGIADEKLTDIARASNASLVVLSSLGDKKQHRWLLGSVAERVAQASPLPVLVVRESASVEAWARGERPLRIMVGVELASTSKVALRWAAGLRAIGPCDLLVTQVAWPFGEHARLGIPSPMPLDHLRAEIQEPLARDLRAWVGDLPGAGETTLTVSSCWGRVDSHLAQLAAEAKADLLVVGTHQRAGVARLWQGSVSRGALHEASCNVACVPRGEIAEEVSGIPTFRRLLVPTDFSPLANRAIAVGYGLVAPGGVVHLLHVVTRKPGEDDPDPTELLRALIPQGAAARGITTELEAAKEADACNGIWHVAGRLGVDAICMATHGRSGASRIVFGSQAQEVVQRARQPVVLVPPERES